MRRFALLFVSAIVLLAALAPGNPGRAARAQSVAVSKACSRCSRPVPLSSRVGQACPHCGAYWGRGGDRVVEIPVLEPPPQPMSGDRVADRGDAPSPADLISPGGRWRARAAGDGFVRIYEAAGGTHVATLAHQGRLIPALFGPGDEMIVTVAADHVRIHALPAGTLWSPVLHTRGRHAEFTPAGGVMVVRTSRISFRDPATGRLIGEGISARPRHTLIGAVLDPRGSRLMTTEDDGRSSLWDVASGRRLAFLGERPGHAAFSPDGGYLVCFGNGAEPPVVVFDLRDLRSGGIVKLEPACYAPYTPDGRRLAVFDRVGIHFLEPAPGAAQARGE